MLLVSEIKLYKLLQKSYFLLMNSVDKQCSIEVIDLVLKHNCTKALNNVFVMNSFFVQITYFDFSGSHYVSFDSRNRQATLPKSFTILCKLFYFGIDNNSPGERRQLTIAWVIFGYLDYADLFWDSNLRGCNS